jgi:hypothetical protein
MFSSPTLATSSLCFQRVHYEFTNDVQIPQPQPSILVTSSRCDPMAGNSLSTLDPAAFTMIDAKIGGQTFRPGTYYCSSLTLATKTKVILQGTGEFCFISGSTMITGANTEVVLPETTLNRVGSE